MKPNPFNPIPILPEPNDSNPPARRRRRLGVTIFSVLLLAVLFTPCFGWIWDGGFRSVEYRLRFVDPDGRPVPGVQLEVFTRAGDRCWFYPVNEFVPDPPLLSDDDGRLVFHHCSNFYEFGGHEYHNLIGMKFGDVGAPHYDCVFSKWGGELFRIRFDRLYKEHRDRTGETTFVSRPFDPSHWARDLKSITPARDGAAKPLDRELSTALRYFHDFHLKVEFVEQFVVVEKDIVVTLR